MISLQEDHINPEAVEVHYQTPEELKLQNSAEPKVVVHDDDIDSVPMEIGNPPASPNRIDPLPPVETPNHFDVPAAPAEAPGEHEANEELKNCLPAIHVANDNKSDNYNPIDDIKKGYENIIVAKDNDNFYIDANDINKCAELNCESFNDVIDNIISVNESYGMNYSNTMIVDEGFIDWVKKRKAIRAAKRKSAADARERERHFNDLYCIIAKSLDSYLFNNDIVDVIIRINYNQSKYNTDIDDDVYVTVNLEQYGNPTFRSVRSVVNAVKFINSNADDIIEYINQDIEYSGFKIKVFRMNEDVNHNVMIKFILSSNN